MKKTDTEVSQEGRDFGGFLEFWVVLYGRKKWEGREG